MLDTFLQNRVLWYIAVVLLYAVIRTVSADIANRRLQQQYAVHVPTGDGKRYAPVAEIIIDCTAEPTTYAAVHQSINALSGLGYRQLRIVVLVGSQTANLAKLLRHDKTKNRFTQISVRTGVVGKDLKKYLAVSTASLVAIVQPGETFVLPKENSLQEVVRLFRNRQIMQLQVRWGYRVTNRLPEALTIAAEKLFGRQRFTIFMERRTVAVKRLATPKESRRPARSPSTLSVPYGHVIPSRGAAASRTSVIMAGFGLVMLAVAYRTLLPAELGLFAVVYGATMSLVVILRKNDYHEPWHIVASHALLAPLSALIVVPWLWRAMRGELVKVLVCWKPQASKS